MVDEVMMAEDVKRGVERMRALQQQEWDDRALGALVRGMPAGFALYRCRDKGADWWQLFECVLTGGLVVAEGDTPEAALRMAMEKGKCSD